MDDESQPPLLFPDDDAKDDDEDLFATPSAVRDVSCSVIFALNRVVGVAARRKFLVTVLRNRLSAGLNRFQVFLS